MGRKQENRWLPGQQRKKNHNHRGGASSLREENTGKRHVDVCSVLRVQHLQRLATWASGQASVPPLGAFLGERLAAKAEDSGVPLDQSNLICQRCETILQPGFNCTIRIRKKAKKARHRKKSCIPSRNNIVYACHYCSHPNVRWGTLDGHVKSLLASRHSHKLDSNPDLLLDEERSKQGLAMKDELDQYVEVSAVVNSLTPSERSTPENNAMLDCKSPMTPLVNSVSISNKRKVSTSVTGDLLGANNTTATDSVKGVGGSSKRRRKGWSSLKEITKSEELENARSISNFAIPFIM
ncbi:uncharacterized protein [Typha latifolia]|uniref:uncharacterized protein n=1 Tax=Typha latifolia TaxID=4733 RepID=UPI003C2DE094